MQHKKYKKPNKLQKMILYFISHKIEVESERTVYTYKKLFGIKFFDSRSSIPPGGYTCDCEPCIEINRQVKELSMKRQIKDMCNGEPVPPNMDEAYAILKELRNRITLSIDANVLTKKEAVIFFSGQEDETGDGMFTTNAIYGSPKLIQGLIKQQMERSEQFAEMIVDLASEHVDSKLLGGLGEILRGRI